MTRGFSRKQTVGLALIAALLMVATIFVVFSMVNADRQSANASIHADYPYYTDLEVLALGGNTVVEGTVIAMAPDQKINIAIKLDDDEEYMPLIHSYDVSTILVTRVFKGNVSEGDLIEVKRLTHFEELDTDHYTGLQGVFFLEDFRDIVADTPFSEVNPYQGTLPIGEDGTLLPGKDNHIFDNASGLQRGKSLNKEWLYGQIEGIIGEVDVVLPLETNISQPADYEQNMEVIGRIESQFDDANALKGLWALS